MNFVCVEFLFFFIAVLFLLLGSNLVQNGRYIVLIGANLFFYSFAGIYFLPVLLFSTLINWSAARGFKLCSKESRKALLIIALVLNLGLLIFFKYYEFLFLQIELLLSFTGINFALPFLDIVFPIGISFYTFQGIAYCVENYKDKDLEPESFLNVLAYLSFFPTVLAGPILRPAQFFNQWKSLSSNTAEREYQMVRAIPDAFALILSGLFKKVVIASYLSEHIVRDIFQAPEAYSSPALLAAVYAYTVQIYCDFSGYSDMAIGIALLLGFKLPQNFDAPYLAQNLQEFWRRWHITLSTWLRDYLYIPLGGNRRGNKSLNLVLTMVLGGLWHGAHPRFIIWGALHGLGLVVAHGFQKICADLGLQNILREHKTLSKVWSVFAWLLCFHFVAFVWVFFRAEDIPRAVEILRGIWHWGKTGDGFAILAVPAIVMGIAMQSFGKFTYVKFVQTQRKLSIPVQGLLVGMLLSIIFLLGPEGVLPFIYFKF